MGAEHLSGRTVCGPCAPSLRRGEAALALPVTAWTDLPTMVLSVENPLLSNIDPLIYPCPDMDKSPLSMTTRTT